MAGVAVAVWPSPTVRMITFLVGGYLIVDGIGDVADSIRAHTDRRLAGLLLGLATVVFGMLGLPCDGGFVGDTAERGARCMMKRPREATQAS